MARIEDAERRAAELTAFTASLHQGLEHLDSLPDRAERCDPRCRFLIPTLSADVAPVGTPEGAGVGGDADAGRTEASTSCSLTGEASRERIVAWREATDDADRSAMPGGMRLMLPVGRAGALAELAAAEQQCCPSLDFRLHLDGGVVHLEVRAPAAAADRITELFTPSPAA
ncbi:hypothetical protein [Streptomyces shenzhenensis]|uniref:hypothetical protein n=1 Tax=Streptomyces shenzhenensis TaxID=943815 RepID=UPI0033D328A8